MSQTVTQVFDAVVLGRSLPGLLAAALLARRKQRVCLLDPPLHAPPIPRPLTGIDSPASRRLLDEIGLIHGVRTLKLGAPRGLRLLIDGAPRLIRPATARADLREALGAPEGRALEAYLDRASGFGDALGALLGQPLPCPGRRARVWWRRTQATPLRQLAEGGAWIPEALAPLDGALTARMGLLEAPSPLTHPRAIQLGLQGEAALRGGAEGLRVLLEDKLKIYGGVCPAGIPESMTASRGGITIEGLGLRVQGRFVLLGHAPALLPRLWGPSAITPAWCQRYQLEGAKLGRMGWSQGGSTGLLIHEADEARLLWRGPRRRPEGLEPLVGGRPIGAPTLIPLSPRPPHGRLFDAAAPARARFIRCYGLRALGLEGAAFLAASAAEAATASQKRRL